MVFKMSSESWEASHGQVRVEHYRQRQGQYQVRGVGMSLYLRNRGAQCARGWAAVGEARHEGAAGLGCVSELEKGLGPESSAGRHRTYIYQHHSGCRGEVHCQE